MTSGESLVKLTLTQKHYDALEALVGRADELLNEFKHFKEHEAVVTKSLLWGLIKYQSYDTETLFKRFPDTNLAFTFPVWGGEGKSLYRLYEKELVTDCRRLLHFKPHEECYLTSGDMAALNYVVKHYGVEETEHENQ